MIVATIVVAAVALAVIAVVAWPLLVPTGAGAVADGNSDGLQDDIDRALRAIREIEFDHAAGNLSDADFAELVGTERARAAELLRSRDSRGG